MIDATSRADGSPSSCSELHRLGFQPLSLELGPAEDVAGRGTGRRWDVKESVPSAPGLYLFTLHGTDGIPRVVYAGQTSDLRMVTEGRNVKGQARPGQRYGRPRWAGQTRQRINVLLSEYVERGMTVVQWVKPMPAASKTARLTAEEGIISRWALRERGWNIG